MIRFLKLYIFLCIVVFVCALLLPFFTRSNLLAYFSPKSENVTELYFEDHLHLPTNIIADQRYYFRFTIHNLTGKNREYPYQVAADIEEKRILMDQNSVTVKKGDYQTIQEEFITNSTVPAKSKLLVTLTETNQQIAFWSEAVPQQ